MKKILFIIFISILYFFVFARNSGKSVEDLAILCDKRYPEVTHITVDSYLKARDKWVLVDVRSPEERAVSTLPGAIDLQKLLGQRELYKDRSILFFCTIGERSSAEAAKQKEKFLRTANLRGGVLAWAAAGLVFITPQGEETRTVHVYGKKWNLLPPSYKGVW